MYLPAEIILETYKFRSEVPIEKYKYVCTTRLETIPKCLKLYRNLRVLSCYNCNLTSLIIPETLVNLRDLQCVGNKLTSLIIPNTLVNLQDLNCSSNNLTSLIIPETLINLKITK